MELVNEKKGQNKTEEIKMNPKFERFYKTITGNLFLHRNSEYPRPAPDLSQPREHDVAEHRRGERDSFGAHHLHWQRNQVSTIVSRIRFGHSSLF